LYDHSPSLIEKKPNHRPVGHEEIDTKRQHGIRYPDRFPSIENVGLIMLKLLGDALMLYLIGVIVSFKSTLGARSKCGASGN
jgi:hypothetical protein